MIIKNALVYTEQGELKERDIVIQEDHFADTTTDETVVDGSGCYAIPGLTDIHFHGCVGYDFCDGTKEALTKMAQYEASQGVTTIVPATMTLAEDTLRGICETAAAYRKEQDSYTDRAILEGINMEGPFIAAGKKGAQNGEYIQLPDSDLFRRLNQASGGCVKLVAIAPEITGALDFIREQKDTVVLSAAHTTADYATMVEAIQAGVSHVTHLYNAMNPLLHRAPGPIGAAADDTSCEVEMITDGNHCHPAIVRATLKLFGDDRVILISDSMMATGMEDGEYQLGGQQVIVKNKTARLADGTLAGSATNLMDCLRTAVLRMNIPFPQAVKCAAVNSAKSVGIYDRYGSITKGKIANVVLLKKEDLSLEKVILKGRSL